MTLISLAENHPISRRKLAAIAATCNNLAVMLQAINGYDLLKQLNVSKILPEVAIINVEMPVMDGLSVAHYLAINYPSIKVLALCNQRDPEVALQLLEAGVSGFILNENFSAEKLSNAIEQILENQIFLDETLIPLLPEFRLASKIAVEKSVIYKGLSKKELNFLQLIGTAITYDQIADLMNVGKESIYNYQKSLKEKLGIASRQEFTLFSIKYGISKIARIQYAENLLFNGTIQYKSAN